MSTIIDLMKERVQANIASEPEDAIQKINEFSESEMSAERKETLKMLIYRAGGAGFSAII